MPEVIKTILTADSSELRAEFGKSTAALRDYQSKQQSGFATALAAHQNEIKALKFEADGFKNLANSLRESTALREQATRLAASANITEKQALAILQEKLLLQKNIVAAALQEAGARQAGAARAAAIANPRATGLPGGGGLAPLTPQSLQAIDRTIASTRELRRQTLLAGQSGKNGALGFLAFSQAVEDAQYGIKGVLNNIPQMILGFGGSAGLAGALSLAAVAAVVLYPKLKELYGAAESESLEKAADAWTAVFTEGYKAANAITADFNAAQKLKALADEYNQTLRARLDIANALSPLYDEQLAADREARKASVDLLQARRALLEAQGGDPRALKSQQDTEEVGGIRKDLQNRQEELKRAQEELVRLAQTRANIESGLSDRQKADVKTLTDLTKQLAQAEANRAQTKSRADDLLPANLGGLEKVTAAGKLLTGLTAAKNLPELKLLVTQYKEQAAAVTALNAKIKEFKDTNESLSKVDTDQIAKSETALQQLTDKINKTNQEKDALKALIVQRQQLLDLENQTTATLRAAAAFKALQDAKKQASEEHDKGPANDPITNRTDELAEQKKTILAARAKFSADIIALKLEKDGRKEVADKLREEVALREQAVALAKELGISESRALTFLREKAKLAAPAEKPGLRGGVPLRSLGQRLPGFGLGEHITRGLHTATLRQRGVERSALHRPSTDPALKALERSANLQEEILNVFKKIGVV